MGRKTKLREAQKHAAEQALCARLREHSRTEKGPAFIGRYAEFALPYQHRLEAYRKYAVRDPDAWRCRLRVRAPVLNRNGAYPLAAHGEGGTRRHPPARATTPR